MWFLPPGSKAHANLHDPDLKGQIERPSGRTAALNRRKYMSAIEETVKLMASLRGSNIARVNNAISNNLRFPVENLPNETPLFKVGAQQLVQLNFASTACACLNFLERDASDESRSCYANLLAACKAYARLSLELCRHFGESRVLEPIMQSLTQTKNDWQKVRQHNHAYTNSWFM